MGQPDIFGTEAAAKQHHGIVHGVAFRDTPHSIMEQIYSQFDALASAATNSNVTLKQLTTSTTNQYAEIKATLDRPTAATCTGAATPAPASNCTDLPHTERKNYIKQIQLLKSTIRNKWLPKTGFFSIHEWGVGPVHTSSECKEKK